MFSDHDRRPRRLAWYERQNAQTIAMLFIFGWLCIVIGYGLVMADETLALARV